LRRVFFFVLPTGSGADPTPRSGRGVRGVGAARQRAFNTAQSQNSVFELMPGIQAMGSCRYPTCVLFTTLGETDLANSRRYPDGTQQQHVERATRWTCAGTCVGQRPNHSVCALPGAEAGARAHFSSPDPSFADSRRRYPRVGCHHDRMKHTVLVHRKLGSGFALSILGYSQQWDPRCCRQIRFWDPLGTSALSPRLPDGRNVRTSRSTSQPRGVSATQWEDASGVLKPALHTAAPSLPRALGPRLLMT
jgi:hypothetical protein